VRPYAPLATTRHATPRRLVEGNQMDRVVLEHCEDCEEPISTCGRGCDVEETYRDDGIPLPLNYHVGHRYCPYSATAGVRACG
jgi:hypothetical protein